MRKTAIFVEGHTELIIVREFLLKYFEYANVDIQCRTLFTDSKFRKAEYDFPNEIAQYHFQIINVGNDNAVLSRMLKREEYMWNSGYHKLIGLRDMYCKAYREESNIIDINLNQKFIEKSKEVIGNRAINSDQILICFAIMEIEAWFLGIGKIFQKLSNELSMEFIQDNLNINLAEIDPEKEFFHPAKVVNEIYSLVGLKYDKKKGDIEAIASKSDKEDIELLRDSTKCASFSNFWNESLE